MPNVDKVCFSGGYYGRLPTLCLDRSSEKSLTVFDSAKKYGGNLFNTIWILPGTTISVLLMSFSGGNLGRTYVKLHASYGTNLSSQYLYLMSYLEKYHGIASIEDAAIVEMICGNTRTILFMDFCSASLVVLSFTDGCFRPLILIPKDRSKINTKRQFLCGIEAMGEIFNCVDTLLLIFFQIIIATKQ